jgi:hypothetical protein
MDTQQLAKHAQRVDDDTLVRLMWTMVRRGQQASRRRGDAATVARYEAAYEVYRAEAERRGLDTKEAQA